MFLGEAVHQVDDKGRLRIPLKFKKPLNSQPPLIMKGINQCLYVYPMDFAVKMFERDFSGGSFADGDENDFKSMIFGSAQIGEEDNQGRVSISAELLEYAGIKKGSTIITVGAWDHFQIWDKELREKFVAEKGNTSFSKEIDKINEARKHGQEQSK